MKHPHEKSRQLRRMQALADVIARRAGVKPVKVVGANSSAKVADEGYVPPAWADPVKRIISINQNPHAARAQFDDIPREQRSQIPAMRRKAEGGLLAHEIGHTAEGQLIRDTGRADTYMAATEQHPRPMIDPALLAKASGHLAPAYQRDQWGLPVQGPGTTHAAANENYADDFANAMGYGAGTSPARMKAMKQLIAMRMLPHAQGGALPGATHRRGTSRSLRARR